MRSVGDLAEYGIEKPDVTNLLARSTYPVLRQLLVQNSDASIDVGLTTMQQLLPLIVKSAEKEPVGGIAMNPMMLLLRKFNILNPIGTGLSRILSSGVGQQAISGAEVPKLGGEASNVLQQAVPQLFGGQQQQQPQAGQ
jgi:hypothetical protein